MKSLKIIKGAVLIIILLFISSSIWAQSITGLNVGYVKEKYRTTVIHIWRQTGKTVWTRTQLGAGTKTKYIEEKRQKDGVYLKLAGNPKEKIKIDIRQKTVFNLYSGAKGSIIETGPSKYGAATVTNNTSKAKPIIKATGQNMTYVKVKKKNGQDGGLFKQTSTKTWKKIEGGKTKATFKETRRGPYSVWLYDANRKITVKIDLHTKKVTSGGVHYFNVYYADARKVAAQNSNTTSNTVKSNIKATGRTVTYAKVSKNGKHIGSFKQTGSKIWKEYKNGKEWATFSETRRGPHGVFLYDKGRKVNIHIDLHTKKVKINGSNYFDVTYADARKVPRSTITNSNSTNNNTNNDAQEIIFSLHIQVEKVDDGDSDEEIFGNLYVNIGGKKTTLFNESEDNHVHLKQWKTHKTSSHKATITNQSISFGGWLKEEDTGGDDNLGSASKKLSAADVKKIANTNGKAPFIVFRHDATVVVVYLKISKISFSDRQAYSVSNIPSLIDGNDLYHYTDNTFKGMKDAFYDKTDKGTTYDYYDLLKITRNNHIQGVAVTDRGRVILSHDVHHGTGYFLYSKPFTKCETYSNFGWFKFDNGSHPSAMQSCGDYVAATVSKQGIYFYKSREDGMYPMEKLTIPGGVNSAGMVYHKKENRYYVLHTNTAHYSANATLKLYRSTKSNLNDARCRFELVSTSTGPASSMGTQLLYQEDGTLYTLCMYTNDDGGDADPITDHIVLSKFSSDKNTCTKVKSVSNYRGTALMTSACFRWAGTCRIVGGKLYVIGVDRSFSDPYVLKYYKTKK